MQQIIKQQFIFIEFIERNIFFYLDGISFLINVFYFKVDFN